MSSPTLEIIDPGMLTTVQDRGRYGYQRFGVPVSGAMDEFALRVANVMVGNDQGAAGLEITVLGPSIRFLADTWIAVTGADLSPQLDGEALPGWQTVEAREGSVLTFGGMQDGIRAYLAVAGGIDVPLVMGSRSTYLKAAIGGLEGRALKKGDVLCAFPVEPDASLPQLRLPARYMAPVYGGRHELRIVPGPQDRAFAPEALSTLLNTRYRIALDSDRMGYRLEGPPIPHQDGPDIVSDGNPLGAIQVPGDGTPTILLADRGTTGGYAKIATVISADIDKLAQALPGQSVSFKRVTVEEAHGALREKEAIFTAMTGKGATPTASPKLSISVDGEVFEVVDEAGETVSQPELVEEAATIRSRRGTATIKGHTYEFQVDIQRED